MLAVFKFGFRDFRADLLECVACRPQNLHGCLDDQAHFFFLTWAVSIESTLTFFHITLDRSTRPFRFEIARRVSSLGLSTTLPCFLLCLCFSFWNSACVSRYFVPPSYCTPGVVRGSTYTPLEFGTVFLLYLGPFYCQHFVAAYLYTPRVSSCKLPIWF